MAVSALTHLIVLAGTQMQTTWKYVEPFPSRAERAFVYAKEPWRPTRKKLLTNVLQRANMHGDIVANYTHMVPSNVDEGTEDTSASSERPWSYL
jgi:hypothetical protein